MPGPSSSNVRTRRGPSSGDPAATCAVTESRPPSRSIVWMPFWVRFQTADFRSDPSAGMRGSSFRQVGVDRDVGLGRRLREVPERVADEGDRVDGHDRERERPAEREEAVDERRETVDLPPQRLDAAGLVGGGGLVGGTVAPPQDVEAEGEGVERVLDLVREARGEVADLGPLLRGREAGEEVLPLAERGGHPVEGDGELPHLVGPVDRDDDVEVSVGDLPGRLGHRLDRAASRCA